MGLVAIGTKFWHIQCDERNCGKKLHHYGEEILKQSAKLLGWENRHNKWACPSCTEERRKAIEGSTKPGCKTSRDLTA
jgi:hypothetical protein